MKRNRFLALILVFVLLFSTNSLITSANSTSGDTSQEQYILTQQEISKFDEYVSLDSNTNEFTIDEKAKKDLTKSEYKKLQLNIEKSNQIIKAIDKNQYSVTIMNPKLQEESSDLISTYSIFHEGVTKVDYYWWGARVYLSKSTLQSLGGGIALSTIWIPEVLVSKIIATLGGITALAPGGIVFDINFWIAGINFITPVDIIPFSAISNIQWQ